MINNEQQIASHPSFGPVLLLAGAGSGKTRTLIERVRRTIRERLCPPEEILILTFSVKAAQELKDRLCETCPEAKNAYTGTIHSFSLHIMKHYAQDWLFDKYSGCIPEIMDENQIDALRKQAFLKVKNEFHGIPIHIVTRLAARRNNRGNNIFTKEFMAALDSYTQEFQSAKRAHHVIDYDDIIKYCCDMLHEYENIKKEVQNRFKFVFVDEFQDISKDLFTLLKLLTGDNGNIFVVGDDFQSIYGFREADLSYIVEFKKYFSAGRILMLASNHRSKKEIIELGTRMITKNRFRTKKATISEIGNGGYISAYPSLSSGDDARIIHKIYSDLVSENKSIAVLCRNNAQIEVIKSNLKIHCPGILSGMEFMTIHAAKGLEFDTVLIAGIEDKIFPSDRSDIEEERRIFYVGITRARSDLVLLYRYGGDEIPQFIRETAMSINWFFRHPLWFIRDYARMVLLKLSIDGKQNQDNGDSEPFSSSII
jgi:superfamily I DNA/RNA helicase